MAGGPGLRLLGFQEAWLAEVWQASDSPAMAYFPIAFKFTDFAASSLRPEAGLIRGEGEPSELEGRDER